ncbi:MAG: TRAP transporter fused permease subunit [Rhodobacteraceae bacterium]|nr:TRAP transporter fused permease subunit [Paracoccaceae bacterium]
MLILLAAIFAAGVIWGNLFVISDRLIVGILFVTGIFTLLFIAVGASPRAPDNPTLPDWALSLASLACGVFFFFEADVISSRIQVLDPLTPAQYGFGTLLLLLTLEATRRTTGMGLTLIVLLFLAYNLFGSRLPPPFGHGIDDLEYLLDILVYTTDGIFGLPIQVVASYVFLFVMFGTLLAKAGGGEFFFNLASALTGKTRGGPAKISVISSGLYGTMSGSPTSDVVATGSITIPIMRRLGYSRRFSGAVEVAASTGGSAMPPIMGSAAFILAEYTGVPYREIVYAAIIPALLYYSGVFAQVHLRAVRHGLSPYLEEGMTLARTFRTGWVFLIPLCVVIGVLMSGYSPTLTAGIGSAAVVLAAALLPVTRMALWSIIEALGETTLRVLPVAGACAAAGLVIGGLSMTGLGMKAANVIIAVSGGDAIPTLLLAAVITIVLGLGMPTPSAYILAAVLVGPALAKVGFPLLESHMFLLYFAILSALTPPIAVAAMAASAIAEEDPFAIAFDAVKLAAVGFALPFVFVWNPAILGQGAALEVVLAAFGGLVAALALAVAIEGMLERTIPRPERVLFLAAAVAAVAPVAWVALGGCAAALVLLGRRLGRAPEVVLGENAAAKLPPQEQRGPQ